MLPGFRALHNSDFVFYFQRVAFRQQQRGRSWPIRRKREMLEFQQILVRSSTNRGRAGRSWIYAMGAIRRWSNSGGVSDPPEKSGFRDSVACASTISREG